MKKLLLVLLVVSFSVNFAQFKDEANKPIDYKSGLLNTNGNSLFGFINPDNFSMHHTFELSYSTFGGNGLALGVYTNSMAYKFSDKLNVEADLSVVNSPYNSFGKEFSKQINGFYLSRAQINYKPTDNMNIMIQYRNVPMTFYNPYSYYGGYGYGYGYSPFYGNNSFDVRSNGK